MKRNKQLLLELLKDADDYAAYKNISCPAIYLLGGSACILGDYFERATLDIDFIDTHFDASAGKIFRLFGSFDMLDLYTTTVAEDYRERAKKLNGYQKLQFYVLSPEDIIVSKLARYSQTDCADIDLLIAQSDSALIAQLIDKVIVRNNLSERVRAAFIKNSGHFRERHNV